MLHVEFRNVKSIPHGAMLLPTMGLSSWIFVLLIFILVRSWITPVFVTLPGLTIRNT